MRPCGLYEAIVVPFSSAEPLSHHFCQPILVTAVLLLFNCTKTFFFREYSWTYLGIMKRVRARNCVKLFNETIRRLQFTLSVLSAR